MAETQLASMFIGNPNIEDTEALAKKGGGNNLFILDGQTDEVLGHINKKYVIENEHERDLPTHKDYFWFTVLADNKHAKHLTKRNGLIVPGEDGELLEFRIFESIKYRNNEGLFIEVHALATYLDLKNQKVFDPQKTSSETAQQHANLALAGTEWQLGEVDFKGIRTLTFDNPFNSYDYILRIAREFELELRFYVTTDGQKVTGRYVDLVEQVGEFRGRTVEFGRDLQRIERKEDTSNVVTALWVYGPEREDGTRLKVFVEDDEARQRWGRRGQHIIDYYEPQTENENITIERLETLGNMELKKRINAVVTYEADILDLENIPGLENKKIRFGDTIRIKDVYFNPPLYVEARAFNVKRDVFNKTRKTVQLGDYVEYTEEEVKALFRQMQAQIQQKISAVQAEQMIEEYAEPKKVESSTPPEIKEGDNPIWVDTSQEPYIPYVADEEINEWVRMTLSDEDVLVNDVDYNGLKWSKDEGLNVERSDGKVRSVLNGTDGIKVQQKDVNDNWVDVFFVDSQGNVKFAGHLEGASGSFSGDITGSFIYGGHITLSDLDPFNEGYSSQLSPNRFIVSYYDDRGPVSSTVFTKGAISYDYLQTDGDKHFTFHMDDAHFTGSVLIKRSGGSLKLQSVSDSNATHLEYLDYLGSRMGFIGYGSTDNDDLYIRNENGVTIRLESDILRISAPLARIGGTSANTTSSLSRIEFYNQGFNTRMGRIGYLGSSDTILGIQNNVGNEVRIYGNMTASGSKSAVVETESYGTRKLYAVEAPDVRFVSYSEHVLEEGEHWIDIEPMFLETINENDYFVVPHVQNASDVIILERRNGKFRVWVYGHTAEVVFEVNGKRKGYEGVYMEKAESVGDIIDE